MKNILIGGAWPYANGSLHIGHIAALLPGDVLARYWRAKGANVFYVSGSDCHGTPITIRAKQTGHTPEEISDFYHREFCRVFEKLGFSYDLYTRTTSEEHIKFVQEFHRKLYESGYTEERTVKQAYCPICQKPLADRLVRGICPTCGAETRGDQCDICDEVLEADMLKDAVCAECGTKVVFKETKQIFLLISKLEKELTQYLNDHPHWRKNAYAFTKRYIDEGLRDRAITRDLDWGIDVPKSGYEDKKIYIWAENVLGYLSASYAVCKERGTDFKELFGEDARHYYVHGKDNIPFHTIILPSLLLAQGDGLHLPDDIISSEYVTLEGKRISTSNNWAVWARDISVDQNPDAVRYFFLANGPEKRDSDFSWTEFAERNNSELVGVWGNFVNRTLAFIYKYMDGRIPCGKVNDKIYERTEKAFADAGSRIENGCFKDALDIIFELIRFGNKYYDSGEPWKTRKDDTGKCDETIYNCVHLAANIAVLLRPFLPFSSEKVMSWLGTEADWKQQSVGTEKIPDNYSILFERLTLD